MEASELEWHKHQAGQIRQTERTVKKAEQSIAFFWWQVGERLNAVYGVVVSKGPVAGNIPFLDMEEITGAYGVHEATIKRARQFHKLAKDETEALRVIEEYGTWLSIKDSFLPGRSADEAKKRAADKSAHDAAIYKALRSRAHIMNVDDDIRDELIDHGLSNAEAREAVRLVIRQTGWQQILLIWKNREQLRAWHEMKAG